jgi:UDP-glucose 4-epimerase
MNIIITGGNGFLGSSIVRKFLNSNHNVLVFSKNSNNISDILHKIKYIQSDNDDLILHKDAISTFQPHVVVHCGWFGGNSHADINDMNQFHRNVPSSIKLIEIINELENKPMFVGFGSFAENGKMRYQISEQDSENPTNLYGLSKLTFKNYSKMLCDSYGIDWTWIKPCYIYGPNDVKTRLIPRLISKFIKHEDVVLDECKSIVDYLYIDDFSEYVYQLITTRCLGVYHLCSGNQYKLRDIVVLIKKLTNSKSAVIFDKTKNRDSAFDYVCGNNHKLKSVLNVENNVNLIEGIKKTINYERSCSNKG